MRGWKGPIVAGNENLAACEAGRGIFWHKEAHWHMPEHKIKNMQNQTRPSSRLLILTTRKQAQRVTKRHGEQQQEQQKEKTSRASHQSRPPGETERVTARAASAFDARLVGKGTTKRVRPQRALAAALVYERNSGQGPESHEKEKR